MDIYRFIDSSAIRAYLKEQDYPFSTQEAAFLVYFCKTAALEEKVQAWEEITRTMPNCTMEKRLNMEAIPDFHAFLRRHIDLQRQQAQWFQASDNCVYLFEDASLRKERSEYENGPFSSYGRCLAACIEEMQEDGRDRARIKKVFLDPGEDSRRDEYCWVNAQGELLGCDCACSTLSDEEFDTLCAFDGMWFDFPTPFHAGDMVYAPLGNVWEPFVLTDIATWDSKRIRQELPPTEYTENFIKGCDTRLARVRKRGDTSDLGASGYTMGMPPNVPGACLFNDMFPLCDYLELEYYPKPLSGIQRLLQPVSNYLKSDKSIEFLLNTYSVLLQQVIWQEQLEPLQSYYQRGSLQIVGLPEKEDTSK